MQLLHAATSSTKKKRGRKSMADHTKKTPRERLQALRARAGISTHAIAKALGYNSASGYHKFERAATQKDRPIPIKTVQKLIPLFRGLGHPPITVDEMMALTDLAGLPRSVVAQYSSPTVDDGKGLLLVKYRVEPGTFVQGAPSNRQYGASKIGATGEFDLQHQFVCVCCEEIGNWYEKGTQLHCIAPSEFPTPSLRGKHVVIAAPYKGGDLVEVVVARVTVSDAEEIVMLGTNGVPVAGTVLGVVIGFYSRE